MTDESWEDATSSFYSRIEANYHERIRIRREYLVAVEAVIRRNLDYSLSNGSSMRPKLLDIGTGDGARLSRVVNGLSLQIYCCEPSRMALSIKRQPSLTNALVSNENFMNFDPGTNEFQYITMMWNVLGHMEHPKVALQRVHELLAKGGTFLFDVNSLRNFSEYGPKALRNFFAKDGVKKFTARDTMAGSTPVWLFSRRALEAWSQAIGFSSVHFQFPNYRSGKLESSDRRGQILAIFRK